MPDDGLTGFPTADDLRLVVSSDPQRAVELAEQVIRDPGASPSLVGVAWSVLGRALFDLGRHEAASRAARRAVELLDVHDDPDDAVLVSLSAAAILAESGDVPAALVTLERIAQSATGAALGRILVQRGYVLHHSGQLHDALFVLDAADQVFGAHADGADRFRLLVNRGLVLLQQGRLDAAEVDLLEARGWAERGGHTSFEAVCAANLGVLHARARRIDASLTAFAEASALYDAAGAPARVVAIMQIDRAEALLHHGMVADAVDAARDAVRLAESTGNLVVLADAHLMYARALLTNGQHRQAERAAEVVIGSMRSTGRPQMVGLARMIGVEASLALARSDASTAATLDAAVELADDLGRSGWTQLAARLRAITVRTARRLGSVAHVVGLVDALRLGAFSHDREVQLTGWYIEAVARAHTGDRLGAIAACKAGIDRLDDIVAEASTLEQRSAAMRIGRDLSQFMIEMAIELGDAETVLAAAEGTRARSLHDELADTNRHRPLTEAGAERLRRELAGRLADRVLVEWVESADEVWAVVVDRRSARLVRVAGRREVVRARDRVLVWLDRAAEDPDSSSVAAARAVSMLDELLVGPLELPEGAAVVIVPVGAMHAVPWGGLPTLSGRSVSLSPNAQLWLAADRRAAAGARTVGLIVGPGVANADVERHAVEGLKADVSVAAGAGATAATVRSMFAGLDVVHVAAHGTFRADHPLLSTLRLHNGERSLYDTLPDRVASRLVVLSSCQGGAHGDAEGAEVLGLAAVMLARGAASVLAPLTVVRELECADFVADVHAELAGHVPIGEAVAAVRRRWLEADDLSRWAVASSFGCFGSDAVTVAAG